MGKNCLNPKMNNNGCRAGKERQTTRFTVKTDNNNTCY